jgi:hypothetical protein
MGKAMDVIRDGGNVVKSSKRLATDLILRRRLATEGRHIFQSRMR